MMHDSNIDSARLLVDVLRGAIEHPLTGSSRRRLLLLLEAIEGELKPLAAPKKPRAATIANRKSRRRRTHH
jgi:hypothetical protein